MITDMLAPFAFVVAAYLVGSIPFPLLIGRLKGIDLRSVGSANVGAGNLTRTGGFPAGLAGAALDGWKGLLPVVVGTQAQLGAGTVGAAVLAAVAGHNWSVFLRGRSGRGLATSAGALLGLNASLVVWPFAWAVAGWKIGGGLGGFVGWGLLPLYAYIAGSPSIEVAVTSGLAVLMIVRRAQGNDGRAPWWGPLVHRVVFDRDRSPVADVVPVAGEAERPIHT
ncbi:MAG: glycerol-3-phosphate acyltransferase [Acidimicrobiia bacterium]